jgi:hypothetical protein
LPPAAVRAAVTRATDATGPSTRGLRSVLVEYERGPDRRAVFPADAPTNPGHGRWLAADAGAFVPVRAWR